MLKNNGLRNGLAPVLAALLLASGPAMAAGSERTQESGADTAAQMGAATPDDAAAVGNEWGDERADAQELVDEAVSVVRQMENDPQIERLMSQAKGIYIVPDFGRAAAGIGVRGGGGVMLARNGSEWTGPAFFDFGGISVGAQAGASAGQIAFLLMTQNAVDNFKQENTWSLNADAGLSIIDYSANTQASWGKGDVIVWSDTEGLFAGIQIGVSDISWDEEDNRAYYGGTTTPRQVLAGETANQKAQRLQQALSS